MIQFEGSKIVNWAAKATEADLTLLMGAEYADNDNEWSVSQANSQGLLIFSQDKPLPIQRFYSFFLQGTFFVPVAIGTSINNLIEATMTDGDRKLVEASNHLLDLGFTVSLLGGDSATLCISKAIKNFQENGIIPDEKQWREINDILTTRPTEVMRCGAKFIQTWVDQSEQNTIDRFDVYRRLLLAYLYRHTGQLDKALEVSEIVEYPRNVLIGTDSNIATLCTTRAGAMMDNAEIKPLHAANLLISARLTLNKANALSRTDSNEIQSAYMRLKKLEPKSDQIKPTW